MYVHTYRIGGPSPLSTIPNNLTSSSADERDEGCTISRISITISEACHMYPMSMRDGTSSETAAFWRTLKLFWSKETIDDWWHAVYGDKGGTEKAQNLLCMAPDTRRLYVQGYFALEPLDSDPEGKWINVALWWLKPSKEAGSIDLVIPPQLPSDFDPRVLAINLHNVLTGRLFRSGDVIKFETPNPATHPLPSTHIIELQWLMQRLAAIVGVAGPYKD